MTITTFLSCFLKGQFPRPLTGAIATKASGNFDL